jgi:UDP-glucose 4-epimerase
MRILITGSSGHLGEALVRTLRQSPHEVVGLDCVPSAFTTNVGSIVDPEVVRRCVAGVDAVIHTATLHKPHVETHSKQAFIDTNIAGTLNLLDASVAAGVAAFVFTSTTSAFGGAMTPPEGAPAVWVTEDLPPVPKNIYGVTKTAAEDLCALHHRLHGLACIVLRTSRFFPEEDDNAMLRGAYADANVKANEYLNRRVEIQDVVDAHLLALERAQSIGFGKYIISATTPFTPDELHELRHNAIAVVGRHVPEYVQEYARRGWKMFPRIDRVYVNERARRELGWRPRYDFRKVVECLKEGDAPWSELARAVGAKGYHDPALVKGSYPFS